MKKIRSIAIAGLIAIVLPFLGLPLVIKKIIFLVMGVGLISVSYLIYREAEIRDRHKLEASMNLPAEGGEKIV